MKIDSFGPSGHIGTVASVLIWVQAVMWKLKWTLEAEAAIFYGSGSGKHKMNGSGSGSGSNKKILEAEAEAVKNSPLPHHWVEWASEEVGITKEKGKKRFYLSSE